jgi:hypothetical protein
MCRDVSWVLRRFDTTRQPAWVTGSCAFGCIALIKEKWSKTCLECPRQVYTVKHTNVGKFGQTGLIIRGDLCIRDIWYCFLSKNSWLQFLANCLNFCSNVRIAWDREHFSCWYLLEFFRKSHVCWYLMATFIFANDYNSLGIVMSVLTDRLQFFENCKGCVARLR